MPLVHSILGVANTFTAFQTIKDVNNALGIVISGAASGGTPSIYTTAPSQATSSTAGTPLAVTGSNAVAGSSVAGAAAGGSITITAGNAARLTSGNANGGNINLTPGTGIGTGTSGQVITSAGSSSAPALSIGSIATTGFYSDSNGDTQFTSSGGRTVYFGGRSGNSFAGVYFGIAAGSIGTSVFGVGYDGTNLFLGAPTNAAVSNLQLNATLIKIAGSGDLGLARNAAGVIEINSGTAGTFRDLILRTATSRYDAIGTTSTDGLVLTNATAAAAGAQQYSPRLRLTGQGWKTNATAASQQVDWTIETQPVQGASAPQPNLYIKYQINNGGYTNIAHFDNVSLQVDVGNIYIQNTNVRLWTSSNKLFHTVEGSDTYELSAARFGLPAGNLLAWSSSTTDGGVAADTALARNGAGIVEVNNGTAGQWGALKAGVRDSATNTTSIGLTLGHQTTGTAAASFGAGLKFNLDSNTTADQDAAQIETIWTTATHASRTSALLFKTVNNAAALTEIARVQSSGIKLGTSMGLIGQSGTLVLEFGGDYYFGAVDGGMGGMVVFRNGGTPTMHMTSTGLLIGPGSPGVSTPATRLHVALNDSATNAASTVTRLDHNSSGTPAAGFGSTELITLHSSTTTNQSAADVTTTWATATHASRKARVVFNVYDTAAREALRIEADGSNPMIGMLGATATARETVTGSRGGNAALADLITKLATKGIIIDGTSA